MITRTEFIDLVRDMKVCFDKEEAFNAALDEYDSDNYHCLFPSRNFFDNITLPFMIHALGLTGEKYEDDECRQGVEELIFWFFYDSNLGEDNEHNTLEETTDAGTIEVRITSAGEFYDYITKTIQEIMNDAGPYIYKESDEDFDESEDNEDNENTEDIKKD